METFKYKKVDAFTSGKSLGNPAACLFVNENQELSDSQMLNIAVQHKGFVSEVVYYKQRDASLFELIYFSSECEVNFCGHGTIACMYSIIKDTPKLLNQKEISIHTRKKGILTIYNRIPEQNAVFISAPKPIYLETNLTIDKISEALHTNIASISREYPVEFIDAGNRTLIVPISRLDDELNIYPIEQELKTFSLKNEIDVILIFCLDTENKAHKAHTRVFAAKYGYLEDPATGSGNAAFGYYMLKNNLWNGNSITLEQGGNDRTYNTIHLCIEKDKLLFGGSATTRIDGTYYI